jgi:hypothetical protein
MVRKFAKKVVQGKDFEEKVAKELKSTTELKVHPKYSKPKPGAPARSGVIWAGDENEFLVECFNSGDDAETIARKHERTVGAVLSRMMTFGLVVQDGKHFDKYFRKTGELYYDKSPNMLFGGKAQQKAFSHGSESASPVQE